MGENLSNIFESHAFDLRVAEVNAGEAAQNADCGVESECTRRCGVFHLGEECTSHDDVGAPVCHGQHHRSHGSNLHREELRAEPCSVSHSRGIEANVDDHADEDQLGWDADTDTCLEGQVVVHWDPVKGDGGKDQSQTHERHSDK